MAQIRRYGPSSVMPEVQQAPQLGNANAQVFETLEKGFSAVNEFIRPAVTRVQEGKGEAEALAALEGSGPRYEVRQTEGAAPAAPGAPAGGGAAAPGPRRAPGPPVQPGPTRAKADWLRYSNAGAIRNKPISGKLESAFSFLPEMGIEMEVFSGGETPDRKASDSGRHMHGNSADAFFWKDGRKLDWANEEDIPIFQEIVARAKANGATGFGAGPGYMQPGSIHVGFGAPAVWGADGKGANAPEWLVRAYGGAPGGAPPTAAEYELEVINDSSFEPRLPFTVRDAAFNSAADRVIGARATEALEMGITIAMQKADGNMEVLQKEMNKVRGEILGSLPQNLPGLRTDLEASFTRAQGVATRQAMELQQRRLIARQTEAQAQAEGALKSEVERIALTGGTSADIAATLAQGQEALVKFGPREGFVLNGREYAPDPTRAGTMTVSDIASRVSGLGGDAQRIMIEAEFQKSAAPGAFVDEFRRQVYAGNSPLGAGESLELLASLESRARATESARRTAANAERERLTKETEAAINPYVEMTEQGVPVAIPAAERASILANLSPFPDLQRQAQVEFAVADAAVATHGLRGPELIAYTDRIRQDIADAATRGELDLEGVAVLQSLEDRVKKITDAVTAEQLGLPLVEQLALDGARPDQVDWDAMRAQAAGKPEVLDQIAVTEAFYNEVANLDGMTANERDAVLSEARARQRELAAQGQGYGAAALLQTQVIEKLESWSGKRKELAANDAMKFAQAVGIPMPSMQGVQTLADAGSIIQERMRRIAPLAVTEGVQNPVPLTAEEVELIAETFSSPNTTRQQQAAFLGSVVGMGKERAQALFAKIGRSEPQLYSAGMVYAMGNQDAAMTILRGAGEQKVPVATQAEPAARATALAGISPYLSDNDVVALDSVAMAYARGLAIKDGQREITSDDLIEGYRVATGLQPDGTGGVGATQYGETILPPGYDPDRFGATIDMIDDGALVRLVPGGVYDEAGEYVWSGPLKSSIEAMQPTADPFVFMPLDAEGARFVTINNGVPGFVTIDLRQVEKARAASEADKIRQKEGEARAAVADTTAQEQTRQASERERLDRDLRLQERLLDAWERNGQSDDLLTRQRAKIADLMAQIEGLE